jgi:hypothetical protein
MPINRRNFLDEILAAGTLLGLMPGEASPQSQSNATVPPPGAHDSISFWNQFYDSQRGPKPALAAPEREVNFLYHGPTGFHYTTDIPKDALLDQPGDVSATINLGQFRPSKGDQAAFKQLQTSSLRIDCVQTRPMMNLFAPLAWAALASLFPDKQGKLPSLQTLGFQSNNSTGPADKVVLPGGLGKLAVNISMVHKESLVRKVLTEAQQIAGVAAPFFGFPAISIPALKAVTAIYSALEQHTTFLLNSPLTMVVATRQALEDETREVQYLPLVSGDYVLVPKAHLDKLSQALDKLDLAQGYLVEKTAPANQPPATRAANAVPDVTYVTMRVTVAPLPSGAATQSKSDGEATSPAAQKKAPTKKKN